MKRITQSNGPNSGTYTVWDEYTAADEKANAANKAGKLVPGSYKTSVVIQNNYDGTFAILNAEDAADYQNVMIQGREGITDGTKSGEAGMGAFIDTAPPDDDDSDD
jgi:hypothetical protein